MNMAVKNLNQMEGRRKLSSKEPLPLSQLLGWATHATSWRMYCADDLCQTLLVPVTGRGSWSRCTNFPIMRSLFYAFTQCCVKKDLYNPFMTFCTFMQRRRRGSYRIWMLMGDAQRPQERPENSGAWDLNLAPAMESFFSSCNCVPPFSYPSIGEKTTTISRRTTERVRILRG